MYCESLEIPPGETAAAFTIERMDVRTPGEMHVLTVRASWSHGLRTSYHAATQERELCADLEGPGERPTWRERCGAWAAGSFWRPPFCLGPCSRARATSTVTPWG